ncbi:MAG: hypothetical protein GX282_07235 [Campylobacteraceae bacterium]|nr:hypothetical protein [Campylobacteraceae bacterium]
MSAYDRQFDAIAKTRVGLSDKEILLLKNPFEIEKDLSKVDLEEDEIDPGLVGKSLNAIVTDRVKINDDWYNLGDYIGSYKIVEIKDKSVVLENEKHSLELNLKQGSQNVIIEIN